MSNAMPKTAQFVVINGKYMPRALYNDGAVFFIYISTNWTRVAITSINEAVLKYSIFRGTRRKYHIIQDAADASANTNVTAIPMLRDTSILFDTPKNEHRARNLIRTILFTNKALRTIMYHVI